MNPGLRATPVLVLVLVGCAHGETGVDPVGLEVEKITEVSSAPALIALPAPAEEWRMGSAVALEGKILIFGGEERVPPTTFERHGRIEMIEYGGRPGGLSRGTWSRRRPSRKIRFRPRGVIDVFDPRTEAWTILGPVPGGRRNAEAAVLGGKLYLVGGWPEQQSRRLDIFDPATGEWSEGPPLSLPRNHHAVAVVGGRLWVYGGLARDMRSCHDLVEVFDPATGQWSEAARDPAACRFKTSAAVFEGKVYLFGGRRDGHRGVAVHDPVAGTFATAGELPQYLYASVGAATLGDRIYLVEDSRNEVHIFDPKTRGWTSRQHPGRPRAPGPLVVVGETVHALVPGPYDSGAMKRPAPGDDEPLVWRCRGVISQALPACRKCRDRGQQRKRWKQLVGEAGPDKLEAARSVEARLKVYNAEQLEKYEAALKRFEAKKQEKPKKRGKAPASLMTGLKLPPGGSGLGLKGKHLPSPRPHPGRLHHSVCYASPGGRHLPAIGKNEGTVSSPRYREGKLIGW